MGKKWLIISILFIGAVLRLIALGSIPRGFTPDEASQAYTAYSLLITGKDEWGISWPLASFKSFLDYKAPLQTYLMMPAIAVFGLNEFSSRLPSAVFGILSIFATYLLCQEIFKDKKIKYLASFFVAISPWHLQFSRMALEVNLFSFLFPMGLFFFIKGLKDSRHYLYSALFFGFSLYTYHAARIFIPLFIVLIYLNHRKSIKLTKDKWLISALIVGILFSLPIANDIFNGGSAKRGSDLLITNLSDSSLKVIQNEVYFSKLKRYSSLTPRLFHNKPVYIASSFVENYLSYFSIPFWFTEGGREITYSIIPGRGLLYFWMLPIVIFGVYSLFKNRQKNIHLKTLLIWMFLAAIPAALTKEGYRPNRAGSFLILWEIIGAYGLVNMLKLEFKFKKIIASSFIVFSLIITGYYFEDYFFNSEITYPKAMSYGWRGAMSFVSSIQDEYDKIIIDRGTQAQSFVAFYNQIDPKIFQENSSVWSQIVDKDSINYLDQIGEYNLGKYQFERLDWPDDRNEKYLYLYQGNSGPLEMLPNDRQTLYKITEPLGGVIIEIFDFKNTDEKK